MRDRLDVWYASRPPGSNDPPPRLGNPGNFFFGVALALTVTSLVFWLANWVMKQFPLWVKVVMSHLKTPMAEWITAVFIVVIGFGFFHVRERFRLIYASIELGAAAATAYFNTGQLADKPTQALLAIMGALYISVRAFDNFDKWYQALKGRKAVS